MVTERVDYKIAVMDYEAAGENELSLRKGQRVALLEHPLTKEQVYIPTLTSVTILTIHYHSRVGYSCKPVGYEGGHRSITLLTIELGTLRCL